MSHKVMLFFDYVDFFHCVWWWLIFFNLIWRWCVPWFIFSFCSPKLYYSCRGIFI